MCRRARPTHSGPADSKPRWPAAPRSAERQQRKTMIASASREADEAANKRIGFPAASSCELGCRVAVRKGKKDVISRRAGMGGSDQRLHFLASAPEISELWPLACFRVLHEYGEISPKHLPPLRFVISASVAAVSVAPGRHSFRGRRGYAGEASLAGGRAAAWRLAAVGVLMLTGRRTAGARTGGNGPARHGPCKEASSRGLCRIALRRWLMNGEITMKPPVAMAISIAAQGRRLRAFLIQPGSRRCWPPPTR